MIKVTIGYWNDGWCPFLPFSKLGLNEGRLLGYKRRAREWIGEPVVGTKCSTPWRVEGAENIGAVTCGYCARRLVYGLTATTLKRRWGRTWATWSGVVEKVVASMRRRAEHPREGWNGKEICAKEGLGDVGNDEITWVMTRVEAKVDPVTTKSANFWTICRAQWSPSAPRTNTRIRCRNNTNGGTSIHKELPAGEWTVDKEEMLIVKASRRCRYWWPAESFPTKEQAPDTRLGAKAFMVITEARISWK